jgi:hypothetical protein
MRQSIRPWAALVAVGLVILIPMSGAWAGDAKDRSGKKAGPPGPKDTSDTPTINLLDAMRDHLVSVQAEGIGDGRMTMSLTNRTRKTLRVVLPPGIVAQGATGQFGGMGGMGGGMGGMGGGMMGGMGGGMGGMGGMSGGMGGMGGMGGGGISGNGNGMSSGTMPPMMGLMTMSRIIMYFCGDYSSWDMRSLMMGMGGGGMGGMGGGMGGMGGGMGGMGGGMRSVPPTDLPSADLKPKETRSLPTRLVSISIPDPQAGLSLPGQGERLEIVGDVGRVNGDPRVEKALKRLAAEKAPTSVSQLVMWRLAGGLDWDSIDRLSEAWANSYERTLAEDFVEHLNALPEGESGRVLFQVQGTDASGEFLAADVVKAVQGKTVLGLRAESGIPAHPEGPAVACRVRLTDREALVQVDGTDAAGRNWVLLGKFSVAIPSDAGKVDTMELTDTIAEGILNRLVRVQLVKGPRERGKLTYQIRIENASPLILNGLAALGTESTKDEEPKVLSGISLSPRKSMNLPASEQIVRMLGLKKGIRLVSVDLSGL